MLEHVSPVQLALAQEGPSLALHMLVLSHLGRAAGHTQALQQYQQHQNKQGGGGHERAAV